MCGFAGEFILRPGQTERTERANIELARAMGRRLRHRGPDEEGSFLSADGRCAIGFQRLKVIDPPGSSQPMSLSDGSLTVAFNGEIYNYQALRRQLERDGVEFHSAGDTEVLLHLYQRYGPDMLEHLDGMFAFVIYDNAAGQLFLARDRLGQKPLWYAQLNDRIVFASEPKALLVHPQVTRHVDQHSLAFYCMLGYIPAPRTIWSGIHKLLSANYLRCKEGGIECRQYWQPTCEEWSASYTDTIDRLRTELTAAVEAHMAADVPLGALLSGGIDSAIIVALMAKAAGRCGGVRTFTAGFDDPKYDEREAAGRIAEHCRTQHTELLVQPDPKGLLDEIARAYDEPFADSSALPTMLICRSARQHVTVALAGDGGDEVFAGYDRYRAMNLAQRMNPAGYLAVRLAAKLVRPFAGHHERGRLRRLVRFADGLPYPFAKQYLTYRAIFQPDDLLRLFTDAFAESHDLEDPGRWFCDLYEEADLPDEVTRAQRHDLLTYLPDDLLVKSDIASMSSSLELRAPMLDHRLVDIGLSLPSEMKISAGRGKAILREAFADLLPAGALAGPKRGFGVPLADWLRSDLRDMLCETLLDRSLIDRGIFREESLAGLVNDHLTGRDDHSHRLWALVVLARWLAEQG